MFSRLASFFALPLLLVLLAPAAGHAHGSRESSAPGILAVLTPAHTSPGRSGRVLPLKAQPLAGLLAAKIQGQGHVSCLTLPSSKFQLGLQIASASLDVPRYEKTEVPSAQNLDGAGAPKISSIRPPPVIIS